MKTIILLTLFCYVTALPKFGRTFDRIKQANFNHKIIGGNNATIDQAPWQAAIILTFYHQDGFLVSVSLCSGSIISPKAVLTTAVCCAYDGTPGPGRGTVKLSHVKYGGQSLTRLPYISEVDNITSHPDFNDLASYNYDYCVIRLKDQIQTSDTIKAIPLADNIPAVGTTASMTGWGFNIEADSTEPDPEQPDLLQYGQLAIISSDDCSKKWNGIVNITDKMLCAQSQTTSPCWFDEGAPLVVSGQLIGINSLSNDVCEKPNTDSYPAIFANTVSVKAWIEGLSNPDN